MESRGGAKLLRYELLLLQQNLTALALWPKLLFVFVTAEATQQYLAGECSTVRMVIAITGCLCCLALIRAIKSQSHRKIFVIRCIFLGFGCLQIADCVNYAFSRGAFSDVHLAFLPDVVSNLYAVTPQLVMGLNGFPIEAYILFIGCHVAGSFLLCFHKANMSWFFAALRALGVHTLPVFAALMVHKRAREFIRGSCQRASQQEQESLSKIGSAKQSSTVVHTPLAGQVVSWPAFSTKVVRYLLSLSRQRTSTLHTVDSSLNRQEGQAGSTSSSSSSLRVQAEAQATPVDHQEQQLAQQQQQQQWRSKEAAEKDSSAAGQEQALSRPVNHTQQGASECIASNNFGRRDWTHPSTHQTHKTFYSSNPALQKALAQATQKLEQKCCQDNLCASKLGAYSSRRGPRCARQGVHESCRIIVKLSGPATPDQIPGGGLARLQHRLRKYQCLAPAVRSGCLIVSFDTAPVNPACSLEEMKEAVLAEAKEWAQEQGLLEPGDDLLTVQACRSTYWDSMLDGQPSPVCSMAMQAPFLIPNLGGFTSASSTQKQQENDCAEMDDVMAMQGHARDKASECLSEQEDVCEFELTICAPEGEFELRGWQGAADAPEELPEAVKSRSLCLLASLEGQFLSITVKKENLGKNGEHVVQVCVRLPDISSGCPRPLMLELWAEGKLVCSYFAIFLPPSLPGAAALAELQVWAGLTGTLPEDSGPFVRDLVRWMGFQATTQQQQQEQEQQQGMGAARDADPADETEQQHLELMTAVGVDLLEFSLSCGMEGVAGLLLECFASFPLCIPPLTLLGSHSLLSKLQALSAGEETTGESSDRAGDALHAVPEDQPGAPPTSTRHSSTQLDGYLHSCSAAPTPSTSNTAATPSTTPTCASSASSAVYCKLAAVARGLHSQLFKEKDADFNAWTSSQVSPLARIWCRVWLLGICMGAMRMALTEGVPPNLEISSWAPVLLAYTVGALFIQPRSRHSELILAAISIARSSFGFMLGSGILPISGTNKLLLRARFEVPAEIIIMPVMERVRLSWMVPLRALMAVGLWLVYGRLGLPWPAMQSVCVNLCSLGVSAAMEQRYSRLYSSLCLSAKQQALDNGGADLKKMHKPSSLHGSAKAGKGEHSQR